MAKTICLYERAKLFSWCRANAHLRASSQKLAEKATGDLGFEVSPRCLLNHWNAVNKGESDEVRGLSLRLSSLETRVRQLEGYLVKKFNLGH